MKRSDLITYTATAPQIDGELIYKYDTDGILREFENKAVLQEDMILWFANRLPVMENWFIHMVNKFKKDFEVRLHIQKVDIDLSFEAFWIFYNYKVGNKTRAKEIWDGLKPTNNKQRMTESNKINAYKIVPKLRYEYKLKNTNFPYLETFLYQRRFDNEF